MSWYTVGEIVAWMVLAALLGFGLGWLLRGLSHPRAHGRAPAPEPALARGTRVEEVDTGDSGTASAPADPARGPAVSAQDLLSGIASRTAGGLTPPHDDLLRIHGVGPKIAQLLVSTGLTSYRQIARLDAGEADVVAEALGLFPGRITRDDWMGSASELHREVYGVAP